MTFNDLFEIRRLVRLLVVLLVVGGGGQARAEGKGSCDRTCLRDALDRYLAAVVSHDPARAGLASTYLATEDAAAAPVGAGLWATASSLGAVQRRYLDTTTGQAAYFGTLLEGGATDVVSLRVKVAERRIVEAEWTIARSAYGGMFSPDGLMRSPPPPDTPLPSGDRTSRAALIAAADAYFEGLQTHDGALVPRIPGCDRVENGVKVTNRVGPPPPPPPGAGPPPGGPSSMPGSAQEMRSGDCTAGFDRFAHTILETSHRRYPVVDEVTGVVLGQTLFRRPPGSTMKRNLLSEYFWLRRGKISAIYATMYYLDPAAPDSPGW